MALSSSKRKNSAIVDAEPSMRNDEHHRLLSEIRFLLTNRTQMIADSMESHNKETARIVGDACMEVFRRKDDEIAQLHSEMERLQIQLQTNSENYNSGPHAGTGESPLNRPTSKSTPKAWSSDGDRSPDSRMMLPKTPEMSAPALRVDSYEDIPSNVKHGGAMTLTDFVTEVQPLRYKRESNMSDVESMFGGPHDGHHTVFSAFESEKDRNVVHPSVASSANGLRSRKVTIRAESSEFDNTESFEKDVFLSEEVGKKSKVERNSRRRTSRVKYEQQQGNQVQKTGSNKAVFIDANAMKEKVKMAVMKKEYSVFDYYTMEGVFQAIARSSKFECVTLAVIAFNALWIAFDADYNEAPTLIGAHWVFVFSENFFTVYFSTELFIRFMAFENKYNCLRDGWFVFDSCLVVMMVLENWVTTLFIVATGNANNAQGLSDASILKVVRMVRIARMARMVRLLRVLPELMILIKGVLVATRSVFFTLCLLLVIIYVFAVGFTELTKGYEPLHTEYFDTVPDSMSTLLLRGTLPDLADLVSTIGKANYAYAFVMLIFILLSSLTVMNMLVGVLVEVVSVVSSVEKEHMAFAFVKTMLVTMLEELGVADEENFTINQAEFEALLMKDEACRIINDVGVDVVGLVDFSDYIFQDDAKLTFPEFMDVVLQLRGSNTATVRDVVDLRKFLLNQFNDCVVRLTDTVSQYFEMLKKEGVASPQDRQSEQVKATSSAGTRFLEAPRGGTRQNSASDSSRIRYAGAGSSAPVMVFEDNPPPSLLPLPSFADTWIQEV